MRVVYRSIHEALKEALTNQLHVGLCSPAPQRSLRFIQYPLLEVENSNPTTLFGVYLPANERNFTSLNKVNVIPRDG
jgi:hypothetical protein